MTIPTIRMIARAVCDVRGLSIDDLYQDRCKVLGVMERGIVAYLAHGYGHSFPRIGRHFGRDHSTIIHHHRKICALLMTSDALAADIGRIRDLLRTPSEIRVGRRPVPMLSTTTSRPMPLATGSVELVSRGKHWFLRSRGAQA